MTNIAVVVPWRDTGDPHRKKNYDFVRKSLGRLLPEAIFIPSDSDRSGSFNRGQARNWGVTRADTFAQADVVVINDADTIPEEQPLREAIYNCQTDHKLHLPYTLYRCLTQSASKRAMRTPIGDYHILKSEHDTEWAGSGTMVIRPRSYWTAGGQPELDGWGFEDAIFKMACDAILGPSVRHHGTVHHLWHPITWKPEDDSYISNNALCQEYCQVEGDREQIEKLISRRNRDA